MRIRRLDPFFDVELLRLAHGWDKETPQWYREMDEIFDSTLDEYLARAREETQANIGLFEGDEMFALVYVNLVGSGVLDAHLAVKRKASPEKVLAGIVEIRDSLFRQLNTKIIYAWLARQNRPLVKMVLRCGFRLDGLTMLKGSIRGKIVEWVRVSCTRKDFEDGERQENTDHHAIGHDLGTVLEHQYLRADYPAGYCRY